MRRRITATALRIIKTPDCNSKGRVEPEDGLSPLSGESSHWGEFPMGRFSAGGARLHELRQPKPANAALHQSRPPRSHGSSLGPEHPQSAIRPARREGPALDADVIEPPPVPPAQRWPDPPRRPRGALPASSPWDPTGHLPAQAPRGCCPGRAAARRTPAAALVQKAQKRPWDGQLRRRKCTKRNAAPKAPQERRRGCTRTPRRRRRSGWTRP